MTFGEKLYQLRKSYGLSQEALAEKLNTSRQAISKWENNNGYPETEKIILISKLFQVNLDDLLIEEKEINAYKEAGIPDEAWEVTALCLWRLISGFNCWRMLLTIPV